MITGKRLLVILSGIYVSALGVVLSLIFLRGLSFINTHQDKLPSNFNPLVLTIFISISAFWLISTGAGIILRRNWARRSLLVMSFLAIFLGLLNYAASLILPVLLKLPLPLSLFNPVSLVISLVFFFAVPVFFIVFFNKNSVRDGFIHSRPQNRAFYDAPTCRQAGMELGRLSIPPKEPRAEAQVGSILKAAGKKARPFGIKFIAILSFLGALSMVFGAVFQANQRLPLFGKFFLAGPTLLLYFLTFAAINFYIAVGLFGLKKKAWIACVAYNIFSILMITAHILTFSPATLGAVAPQLTGRAQEISLAYYKITVSIFLLIPVAILVYLLSKKQVFFNSENHHV